MEQKEIKVNGILITGYKQDYVFQKIESSGDFYEGDLLRLWTPMLEEPRIIFDIGANLGNHSLYWAQNLKPKKIYAFEPYNLNFLLLKKNIEANCPEIVKAVNKAVGLARGFASIKRSDDENMGATVFEKADSGVEMTSLDDFCSDNEIEMADFVKIDTEGFEIEVIRGMQNMLLKSRPDLWIETGSENCGEILRLLEPFEYVLADVWGANLFFLNPMRHSSISIVQIEYVLQNMLKYLEKTNTYYGNYEKVKHHLSEAQNKYRLSLDNYNSAKTKLSEAYGNTNKLHAEIQSIKEMNAILSTDKRALQADLKAAEAEAQRFNAELKRCEQEKKQSVGKGLDMIRELVSENDESISLLLDAQREIKQLRVQRDYLKRENEEQKVKLSKIYDTRYGRFALRCYKLLKKCWQPVKRLKNKLFR